MSRQRVGASGLNQSIRSACGRFKSCPSCSVLKGRRVLFVVAAFGYSPRRRSLQNPDGIQSWCWSCRRRGLRRTGFSAFQLALPFDDAGAFAEVGSLDVGPLEDGSL